MTAPHFVVFVGASPSLSTELTALKGRFEGISIVAPAVGRHERGITTAAIRRAMAGLIETLRRQETHREPARLSVWSYEPTDPNQFGLLWSTFGKSAWIELIPRSFTNKDRQTRLHLQNRLDTLVQLIHVVAGGVYSGRRSSPLSLPFGNFRNNLIREFENYWYRGSNRGSLARMIEIQAQRFRQLRTSDGAHSDDRALLFAGAQDAACHGQPHPVGDLDTCFVEGRFRFGAALFPGFHYDVRKAKGLLDCTLYDCRGVARDLRPEKRTYINIFPNDHLLPAHG
jgi:hypothetical protein